MKKLLAVCLVLGSAITAAAADVDVNLGTVPPGKTVTIRFRATVNGPLPAGIETVQNQGSISGTNLSTVFTDDPDTGAPGDATSTVVIAMPDMAITKTDGVTAAVPGGTLTYSLLVSNVGNQDATGVLVIETVPMGTTFDAAASSPGWSCPHGSPGNTSCSLGVGAVGVGSGIVRTFAVVVDNPPPPAQGSIVNTALVIDDGFNGPDPNTSNNQATDTDALGTDLQMAVADAPDPVTPGNALTYTLTATNAGPGIADAASVSHTLPPGTVFVSLAAAPGWACTTPAVGSAGSVTCTIATFPITSAVFTLVVGVAPSVEHGTVIAASATVASTTAELNAANNTGNASTTVQEATSAPVRPTQISPTGTIGTGSPTYVWNLVPGAEEYSIWIGTSTTNLLTGPTWIPAYAAGCGATTCSFTPALILANGSYQWWVQARNDVDMGQWSTGLSFTVAVALPGPTTPLAPSGVVTSTASPTYQWTPATGATQYDLYVNNTSGAIFINTTIAAPACAPTCSAPGIALPDGSYEFWVRGKNTGGGGPWGGPLAFTIDAQPNPPTLIGPTGIVTTPRPVFRWNAVAGAVDYQLHVTDATAGVLQAWYSAASVCSGATCSVQPSTNLQEGPHQFRVRVRDTAGTSPWSLWLSFLVTKPNKPIPIGPSGATSDPTPTYQWQESPGATEYQLWVESPTNSIVTQGWYDAATACSGGTCSVTPTASLYNGVNRFWVKARSCNGASDWSNEMAFTETGGTPLPIPALITAAPTGAAPTGTITTNTATFTWNAVPNALDYQIVVSNGYTRRFSGLGACSGGTCSVTPTETFANGAYTWTVQPQNQAGNGPMSAPVAFTVNVGAMVTTLQTPVGPAGTNTPLFTWNAAPGATEYYLWLDGPGGVYTSWFAASAVCTGATCSVNPGNVLPPGSHRWWILPRNCTAAGSWAGPLTFLVP